MKVGAHVSIGGGIEKAPERAYRIGCECFQFFSRPPRGGSPPKLDDKTVKRFLQECTKYNLLDYYIHTPYFINLASDDKQIRTRSVSIIKEELKRGDILGAKYVVTHLGSSKASSRKEGLKRTIKGLKQILEDKNKYSTKLLIENSAGQGATIGDTLEELAEIVAHLDSNPDIGICLDTAHLFASGYDIRTKDGINSFLTHFSETIGFSRLKLLHGNDSKVDLGERKDRHEHIGKGKIGIECFKTIVNEPALRDINLIIETPFKKIEDDIKNLKKLKNLRDKI